MPTKTAVVPADLLKANKETLRKRISAALKQELEDCAIPDLDKDPVSGALWGSLPTVDSKTAFKISASIVEEILGCQFKPAWIQKGGYQSIEQATQHVLSQLEAHSKSTLAAA
jgi:hypothetical protein